MSSAGHVFDMINRLKQNGALKSSKRRKFKSNDRAAMYVHEEHHKTELHFPHSTPEELEALKHKIREDADNTKRRVYILYSFAGLFFVGFLIVLYLTF